MFTAIIQSFYYWVENITNNVKENESGIKLKLGNPFTLSFLGEGRGKVNQMFRIPQ